MSGVAHGLQAKFLANKDQDAFVSPENWDFSIYGLEPKKFWYSKTSLPVSTHCEIVRYDFRSRVRFRAGLKTSGLQINFIDSYSTTASRLQGMGKIDSILMITLGGYDWDGMSDVGALGIEINFDDVATRKIVSDEALFVIGGMAKSFGKRRSIVVPPSQAALRLKEMALRHLATFDREAGIIFDDGSANILRPAIDIPALLVSEREFFEGVMIEMAENVLQELTSIPNFDKKMGSFTRRELALKVERLLWEHPLSRDTEHDFSLDELAVRLKVSRRTIQTSLQEQFGLGFVSLRKLIRLHQLRRAIRTERVENRIGVLGSQFYLSHFGRLAKEYKELFGLLPSAERSQ